MGTEGHGEKPPRNFDITPPPGFEEGREPSSPRAAEEISRILRMPHPSRIHPIESRDYNADPGTK